MAVGTRNLPTSYANGSPKNKEGMHRDKVQKNTVKYLPDESLIVVVC